MKIICIGRNYKEHAKELNNAIPTEPVIFQKPATALLKENANFILPRFSNDIHHEIEVVLKISKKGKNIDESVANHYYDEITVGIDFTARDIQSHCKKNGLPWEITKAFDGSAVVGKFISKNLAKNIDFNLLVNAKNVQTGNTKDMIFSFDYIVSYASQFFTLEPEDLIFTGTPAGVGPVHENDFLEGYLNQEKLFECHISSHNSVNLRLTDFRCTRGAP